MILDVCCYSVLKVIYVQLLELVPALKCHYAAAGRFDVYQT